MGLLYLYLHLSWSIYCLLTYRRLETGFSQRNPGFSHGFISGLQSPLTVRQDIFTSLDFTGDPVLGLSQSKESKPLQHPQLGAIISLTGLIHTFTHAILSFHPVYMNHSSNKVHPRTDYEGPNGEKKHSPTLSLTSALDGGGWNLRPVWMGAENLVHTRIRSSDPLARSESLYRPSYLGPLTPLTYSGLAMKWLISIFPAGCYNPILRPFLQQTTIYVRINTRLLKCTFDKLDME
jgi:hypothetical protein